MHVEASPAGSQDSVQLIYALAQAHLWLEQLLRGEVASLRMIANSAQVSERYVSGVLRCAFLAPDLVEAILQVGQPPGLTLRNLVKHLPMNWSEQRRMFGLAAEKASLAGLTTVVINACAMTPRCGA